MNKNKAKIYSILFFFTIGCGGADGSKEIKENTWDFDGGSDSGSPDVDRSEDTNISKPDAEDEHDASDLDPNPNENACNYPESWSREIRKLHGIPELRNENSCAELTKHIEIFDKSGVYNPGFKKILHRDIPAQWTKAELLEVSSNQALVRFEGKEETYAFSWRSAPLNYWISPGDEIEVRLEYRQDGFFSHIRNERAEFTSAAVYRMGAWPDATDKFNDVFSQATWVPYCRENSRLEPYSLQFERENSSGLIHNGETLIFKTSILTMLETANVYYQGRESFASFYNLIKLRETCDAP